MAFIDGFTSRDLRLAGVSLRLSRVTAGLAAERGAQTMWSSSRRVQVAASAGGLLLDRRVQVRSVVIADAGRPPRQDERIRQTVVKGFFKLTGD